MNHELVTALTPTCQLGVAAGNRSVAKSEAAKPSAQRLEDVEKLVRSHDQEIEAIIVCVGEILDTLSSMGHSAVSCD